MTDYKIYMIISFLGWEWKQRGYSYFSCSKRRSIQERITGKMEHRVDE